MAFKDKISVNGFTTEYIKFGTGKKTLVILPGLSIQSVLSVGDAIEKQYAVFLDKYTVYLFERRQELPVNYSVYGMADDIYTVLRALNINDICLFGVSQGGMIAMLLTAEHPELVDRLAVCSTAAYIDSARASVINEWIFLASQKRVEDLYLSFAKSVYPEKIFAQYKDFWTNAAQSVTDRELEHFIGLAKATEGFDIRKQLNKISCPVLVAGDRQDTVLGLSATEEITDCIKNNPSVRVYVYNGFGHAVYDTAPDFTQRLYNFFEERKNK